MVSAEFRRFRAVFKLRKVFQGFCRFPWVQLCLESFAEPQEQKLEKGYHGRCAALRQILYLCRDHFWSQKKVEFCYRFEGGLHGCHKCVLQLKERVVKKARAAFEITLKLIIL